MCVLFMSFHVYNAEKTTRTLLTTISASCGRTAKPVRSSDGTEETQALRK